MLDFRARASDLFCHSRVSHTRHRPYTRSVNPKRLCLKAEMLHTRTFRLSPEADWKLQSDVDVPMRSRAADSHARQFSSEPFCGLNAPCSSALCHLRGRFRTLPASNKDPTIQILHIGTRDVVPLAPKAMVSQSHQRFGSLPLGAVKPAKFGVQGCRKLGSSQQRVWFWVP